MEQSIASLNQIIRFLYKDLDILNDDLRLKDGEFFEKIYDEVER